MEQLPPRSDRLSAEIRAELGRQNRSRKDLAAALHMEPVTLWRRMSGKSEFTFAELVKVADFFGIAVSTFLARTDETTRSAS